MRKTGDRRANARFVGEANPDGGRRDRQLCACGATGRPIGVGGEPADEAARGAAWRGGVSADRKADGAHGGGRDLAGICAALLDLNDEALSATSVASLNGSVTL